MTLGQYLSGFFHARSDYRVLMASDIKNKRPYLHEFNESKFGNPVEQFNFDGRNYSRSSLNYLLGLSMLKQHIDTESIKTVLEIGGGFGTLGEILSQSGLTDIRYIDVDIPPVQYVAAEYLKSAVGHDRVLSCSPENNKKLYISTLPMVSVFCNWQIEQLLGEIDLFVNFISFQEMEPFVVSNYLRHIDRLKSKWILLRNMREGKQKKTSTSLGVEVPILSEDYLGMLSNYRLIARNVHPFGFETVDNFHSELLLLERLS
jgi:putative sugar O-methyltransferase